MEECQKFRNIPQLATQAERLVILVITWAFLQNDEGIGNVAVTADRYRVISQPKAVRETILNNPV
jgi:hypothetical protein